MVDVPTVVGWLRPAILLPAATLAGLSAAQLEAILAHELAHVRRHDYLASLLQSAVETVLFYHPAVWWVSHRMRVERELCCDDEAVAACGNPVEYARALAGLESLRAAPRLAPAATGGPLFERIARLVAAPSGHGLRATRGAAALLGGAALALALTGVTTPASPGDGEPERDGRHEEVPRRSRLRFRRPPPAPPGPRPRGRAARSGGSEVKDEVVSSRPVPVERLIELAGAGVTPGYVDEMAALGYPSLSWDQLIQLRTQGVGPDYVRGLADAGYPRLTPDQLVSLRSQGVSPDFVRGLTAQGMKDLSLSDLLALRSQGVSPEYVRNLRAAGYADLSVTDLLGARSSGVSPEDAAALRDMGYTDLSLSRLVGLRSRGVTAEYVRGLQEQGYKGVSAPMLFGLRSQGVTVEYIRELKDLGYTGLAAGELIELRSQGVTPEFVRELKEAGYDRLTVRELIELRSHGVDPALLKRLKARGGGKPMKGRTGRIVVGLGVLAVVGTLVAAASLRVGEAQGGALRGVWTAQPSRWKTTDGGTATIVQLSLRRTGSGHDWNSSFPVALADLRGLTAEQTRGGEDRRPLRSRPGRGHDRLRRAVRRRKRRRTFHVRPQPRVPAGHAQAGLRGDGRGEGVLPRHPRREPRASSATRALGYTRLDLDALVNLRIHGASPDFIRELKALGYEHPSVDELVNLRIHGASPAFIRELKGLGYERLAVDELVNLRIHGASAEFIRSLKELGYEKLDPDGLVNLRIHGASPEFVRDLRALGYATLSTDELVNMRIHGVSSEFIRALRDLGYQRVPVDDLVNMRIHGVTPEFIRRVNGSKSAAASVDQLVNMRIHGREE